MKKLLIGLTLFATFSSFAATQKTDLSCRQNLTYEFTFSALASMYGMPGDQFIEEFIVNENAKSLDEAIGEVKINAISERAKNNNFQPLPLNLSLIVFAKNIEHNGLLKSNDSRSKLFEISSKHFENKSSTVRDLVLELSSENVLSFSVCD